MKVDLLTPEQREQKRAADRERYNKQIAGANNAVEDKEFVASRPLYTME